MILAALRTAWLFVSGIWSAIPANVRTRLLEAIAIAMAVLLLWLWHVAKVHEARVDGHAAGVKEAETACAAANTAREKRQAAADAKAQGELDHLHTLLAQQQIDQQQELDAERQRSSARLAQLKKEEPTYVPNLVALDDAPIGYVLWRAATATFANGADLPPPPDAADNALAGPSGVPLTAIADTDLAQASAFRDAVTWGRAWQQYAFDVKAGCEQSITILKGSAP